MANVRQNKKYEQMYELYKEGYSLAECGKAFGITRQSVFTGLKRRGYQLRTAEPLPFQFFEGVKYSLRNTGYYGKTYGSREQMHRAVWMYYNGAIPEGYDIHHIDHDKGNNRIENLELLRKDDHARLYSPGCNGTAHTERCPHL